MGKPVKERLRDQEKEVKEQLRKQILNEMHKKLQGWITHVEKMMQKKAQENYTAIDEMGRISKELKRVSASLSEMRQTTNKEVKQLRKKTLWKVVLLNIVISIFSSFVGILIAAKYWQQIRSLFL